MMMIIITIILFLISCPFSLNNFSELIVCLNIQASHYRLYHFPYYLRCSQCTGGGGGGGGGGSGGGSGGVNNYNNDSCY